MTTAVAGPEIERLIQLLARLPGLGPRSARRAALALIKKREQLMAPLAGRARDGDGAHLDLQAVRQYRQPEPVHGVHRSAPRSVGDRGGRGRRRSLGAGARPRRERALSCARRHAVAARRHRPAGPVDRCAGDACHASEVKEIILALNATVDGQTTAHYITDLLGNAGVRVTRLAHGVPVGGELDYLDEGTLAAAIKSRTPL